MSLSSVETFDRWADGLLERMRGKALPDAIFTGASDLGDFSAIWHLIGAARGIIAQQPEQAAMFSAFIGAESLIVNQGIKRIFRRRRPTVAGDPRYPVRKPSTSSFPSGHSSAAFFAATILTAWGGKRTAPLWFSAAATVATSRAYVRIHFPSDVVGGAAVGLLLGRVARRRAGRIIDSLVR